MNTLAEVGAEKTAQFIWLQRIERTIGTAVSNIIDYVENPDKTDNDRLITSYQWAGQLTAQAVGPLCGDLAGDKGLPHLAGDHIICPAPPAGLDKVLPLGEKKLRIRDPARRFTKGNHAFIVCTRIDKVHIHNHIIWNSAALDCTRKFRDFRSSGRTVRRLNEYHLH